MLTLSKFSPRLCASSSGSCLSTNLMASMMPDVTSCVVETLYDQSSSFSQFYRRTAVVFVSPTFAPMESDMAQNGLVWPQKQKKVKYVVETKFWFQIPLHHIRLLHFSKLVHIQTYYHRQSYHRWEILFCQHGGGLISPPSPGRIRSALDFRSVCRLYWFKKKNVWRYSS